MATCFHVCAIRAAPNLNRLRTTYRPHALVGPVSGNRLVRICAANLGEAQREQLQSHDGGQLGQDRMSDRRLVDAGYREPLGAGGPTEGRDESVTVGGG